MSITRKLVVRIAVASGATLLCLVGPFVFAVGISEERLECFEALVERKAPLSEYTYFLGEPEDDHGPGSNCFGYDTYFGAVKFACHQESGQVVSAGGQYSCGASLLALARHSYGIAWRVAASADERRVLRCE
ncbi:MAG: hypothetical protein GY944_26855 [bacterium]|nr:hypothetical protein [bacterium]